MSSSWLRCISEGGTGHEAALSRDARQKKCIRYRRGSADGLGSPVLAVMPTTIPFNVFASTSKPTVAEEPVDGASDNASRIARILCADGADAVTPVSRTSSLTARSAARALTSVHDPISERTLSTLMREPPSDMPNTSVERVSGLKFWSLVVSSVGVIYGDIGTSPLYAYSSIYAGLSTPIDEEVILGGLSLVIWSILFIV